VISDNASENRVQSMFYLCLCNIHIDDLSVSEFFRKLVKWSEEFGDIYLIWVGMRPFIFLYKMEAVQALLSSSVHISKSLEYQYLKPWLGTGLLTSNGKHFTNA